MPLLASGPPGLAFGLVVGLVLATAIGLASSTAQTAWSSYRLSLAWLVVRHLLPWRLMDFLDDAHKQGVLRQEGAYYQFRHIQLQEQIAA